MQKQYVIHEEDHKVQFNDITIRQAGLNIRHRQYPILMYSLYVYPFLFVDSNASVHLLSMQATTSFQVKVFWIVMPCSVAVRYWCSRGHYCLHL